MNIRASVLLCVSRTILMRRSPRSCASIGLYHNYPHALHRSRIYISVTGLLYYLHQQPRFGWRITLLPLLELYWQQSDPARRTVGWLRMLKRLRKAREPRPLRLSPLHMDVHAGNLVHSASGLKLIDWEYAGDGDIALELAAVWVENTEQHRQLVNDYATRAKIYPAQLWRQVRRWFPWLLMLKAGWFEYRWRQTGDQQFIRLADDTWRQLLIKQ